jgi:hypothetical protein
MQMKNLIILSLPFFLTACFDDGKTYDCNGMGLKITNSKATFGPIEFNLCRKEGLFNYYKVNCKSNDSEATFDTVTHYFSFGSQYIKCTKTN